MNIYTDYGFCPECKERRDLCQCETSLPYDEELDDDGVYIDDVVIHAPYDEDEE